MTQTLPPARSSTPRAPRVPPGARPYASWRLRGRALHGSLHVQSHRHDDTLHLGRLRSEGSEPDESLRAVTGAAWQACLPDACVSQAAAPPSRRHSMTATLPRHRRSEARPWRRKWHRRTAERASSFRRYRRGYVIQSRVNRLGPRAASADPRPRGCAPRRSPLSQPISPRVGGVSYRIKPAELLPILKS
jgi:hypothetical protein